MSLISNSMTILNSYEWYLSLNKSNLINLSLTKNVGGNTTPSSMSQILKAVTGHNPEPDH